MRLNYYKIIFGFITLLFSNILVSQNSMVGDGFGGRLWYQPTNYSVGSYTGYRICYTGSCGNSSNQLYGWGLNNGEPLGISSSILSATNTPIPIPNMSNVKYFSAGYNVGAIKKDSSGWAWGMAVSTTPAQVISNAKFLDASSTTISFVKYDGTVWSIGGNNNGNFGDSTTNGAFAPVQMRDVSNAVRVANNGNVTIILLADGTLKSVGSNSNGFLGIGTSAVIQTLTPVVIPLLTNIVDVKATVSNIAALDNNGDVYTWGNGNGIGDGDISNEYNPKKVTTLSNIVAISGCDDGDHFLALDQYKNCYAWGGSNNGQMGVPYSTSTVLTPTLVATDVIDIMAGETFSYLVKTNGTLWYSGGSPMWLDPTNTFSDTFKLVDSVLVYGACSVSVLVANTTAACGGNNGSITITNIGGQVPYTYNIGSGNQNSNTFSNLAAGNYTATITDNNSCVTTITCAVSAGSGSSPTVTVNSSSICAGTSALLAASGATNYTWASNYGLNTITGSTVIASPSVTTIYTITGTNNDECSGIGTSTVTVLSSPTASFSNISTLNISTGTVLQLDNQSTNASSYKWEFCDGSVSTNSNVSVALNDIGECCIKLIAYNNSCSDAATQCVNVFSEFEILIPNVFTPNGDNANDLFKITSSGVKTFHCEIYNRWGIKLYEWNDVNGSWDGKTKTGSAPAGTYFYILNYTGDNSSETKKGFLSLFRD